MENELQALQGVVGGYIEVITPWADPVLLVCDEEGLYKPTPWNRGIKGQYGLIINGFCDCSIDDVQAFLEEMKCPPLVYGGGE